MAFDIYRPIAVYFESLSFSTFLLFYLLSDANLSISVCKAQQHPSINSRELA